MSWKAKIAGMTGRATMISVIADEDTITGFLLTGVGDASAGQPNNYMVVDQDTPQEAIEERFKAFTTNDDISVILISQEIASKIRWLIDDFESPVPSILEIPTKSQPYDPEQDPTYERIKRLLGGS